MNSQIVFLVYGHNKIEYCRIGWALNSIIFIILELVYFGPHPFITGTYCGVSSGTIMNKKYINFFFKLVLLFFSYGLRNFYWIFVNLSMYLTSQVISLYCYEYIAEMIIVNTTSRKQFYIIFH